MALHPGAQPIPTDRLILTLTASEEDFCIGVEDPSGNRAAEEINESWSEK